MTNYELYDIVKECVETGDNTKIKYILPNHYLSRGEKFALYEGKPRNSVTFANINDIAGVSDWSTNNYKLSGKYSDYLSIIFLPDAPNIRLEIRNKQIVSALWVVSPGLYVDVMHNIYFLNHVPLGRMIASDGYVHGAIISKLPEPELYKLITSPFSDKRILDCEFIVTYASFDQFVADTINDLFEAFKKTGFKTVNTMNTTVPKWPRTIESAKLVVGSGNISYQCNKVLTLYTSMGMIQLLSMKTINHWGITTNIVATNLFEVLSISWDTVVEDNRVRIFPVIAFKFSGALNDTKGYNITIDKINNIFYYSLPEFTVKDIGAYCIGDIFTRADVDDVMVLNKKYGSGKPFTVTPSCPKCGHGVDIFNDKIYCINPKCPAVVANNINMWVNKFCPTVNEYTITDFLRRYEINDLGDIYMIMDSLSLPDKEYVPIFAGVHKSREMPGEFLNIIMPFLDIKECNEIMRNFNDSAYIDLITAHLFTNTTLSRIGFDDITINKVLNFMEVNKIQFVRLITKYFNPSLGYSLHNKTFFIDGLLYDRDKTKYENIINRLGGRVISQFAPYITGFIYGEFGDKTILETVRQLSAHKDIAIYSEEEFNKLVEQANGGSK